MRPTVWANRFVSGTGWGGAVAIESDNSVGFITGQGVAIDSMGNAIAVWDHPSVAGSQIWANRSGRSGAWAGPERLDSAGGASPFVAGDVTGRAIAIWRFAGSVWVNQFTTATGWGTAERLGDASGGSAAIRASIDSAGNALAGWSAGLPRNTWVSRFTSGGSWGSPQVLETDNSGDSGYPALALDERGDGMAAWSQSNGSQTSLWANRFTLAGGWAGPRLLENDDAGDTGPPRIAMDSRGNAIAVWRQSDGTRENIWACRFTPANDWATPVLLETDAGDADAPRVAINGSGNAVAAWQQSDGMRTNIWSARFE